MIKTIQENGLKPWHSHRYSPKYGMEVYENCIVFNDKKIRDEVFTVKKNELKIKEIIKRNNELKKGMSQHEPQSDKLFITEILNDLYRNGFVHGGKAERMLCDWSHELKNKSRVFHSTSRLKKCFAKIIGLQNW